MARERCAESAGRSWVPVCKSSPVWEGLFLTSEVCWKNDVLLFQPLTNAWLPMEATTYRFTGYLGQISTENKMLILLKVFLYPSGGLRQWMEPERRFGLAIPSRPPLPLKDTAASLEKGLKAFDCQMEVVGFSNRVRNMIVFCYFHPILTGLCQKQASMKILQKLIQQSISADINESDS